MKHSTKVCRKSEQNPSLYIVYMMLGRVVCGNSLQLMAAVTLCNTEAASPIRWYLQSPTHLAVGHRVLGHGPGVLGHGWDMDTGVLGHGYKVLRHGHGVLGSHWPH